MASQSVIYGFKLEISQFTPNENVIQWRRNKLSHGSRKPQELFQLLLHSKGHSFSLRKVEYILFSFLLETHSRRFKRFVWLSVGCILRNGTFHNGIFID